MNRIRIRCIALPPPPRDPGSRFPITGFVASWNDVEVLSIDEDGEHPITCVEKVEFTAQAGTEPARAIIYVVGAELEVEGVKFEVSCPVEQDDDAIRRIGERLKYEGNASRTVVLSDGSFAKLTRIPI